MTIEEEELEDLVREVAESAFGFDALREGQQQAAAALLAGRDVLAVMPTGSGKSAIYQLTGPLIRGTTLVVSPLLALQHDQVERIGDDLGGAAKLNSSMSHSEREAVFDAIRNGTVEFVFLAPEQLANDETFARIAECKPELFVVDEAHCISTWGHDFRTEYLRLGERIRALGQPQILGLTATAAPPVRREIVEQLGMRDPVVVVAGFDRPNISLRVETLPYEEDLRPRIVELVAELDGTGIVYVATRRDAVALAGLLDAPGRPAAAYHAGLARAEREAVHERFLNPEPIVVVATTAFGMGIDAPHVRFVLHVEPPESLDAYYQEFGRAGRDGDPARAILLAARQGGNGRRFFGGMAELDEHFVTSVVEALVQLRAPVGSDELARVLDSSVAAVRRVVHLLVDGGAVRMDGDEVAWRGRRDRAPRAIEAAMARHEQLRALERSRAEMMARYLDTNSCRWAMILGYFGDPAADRCGRCDNCESHDGEGGEAGGGVESADDERPFPLDTAVRHREWGCGVVVGYDDDTMTVLFDDAGYRTLSVALVVERGLLRIAPPPASSAR